jgi:hypothetical protein
MQNQFEYNIDVNQLTESYEDFIGTYEGFFPSEFCKEAISYFNFCQSNTSLVKKRRDEYVEDSYLFTSSFETVENSDLVRLNKKLSDYFFKMIDYCILKYIDRYKILKGLDGYSVYDLKFQKSQPGEAFHGWHYENTKRLVADRRLVFQLYLNDVEEGGETEFLYYPKRIKATQGKLIIWPATFTHTHRGNTPLTGDKYIITSWVEGLSS